MAKFSTIASGLPYGYSLLYVVEIEGIAASFVERDDIDGLSGVVNYPLVPGLRIEGSPKIGSVIDRRSGIGKAFSLAFTLERSTFLDTLMSRPVFVAPLRDDLAFTDTAGLRLKLTTGLVTFLTDNPTNGNIYIGRERITYTGSVAGLPGEIVLNGLTRGSGGDWTAYDHTKSSVTGSWVSDAPRIWRGREVKMYAIAVGPYGCVDGSAAEVAHQSWRGWINDAPEPNEFGWAFNCRPLDRRLKDEVGTPVSGTAYLTLVQDPTVQVPNDLEVRIELLSTTTTGGFEFASKTIRPFEDLPAFETITRMQEEWSRKWEGAPLTSEGDAENTFGGFDWEARDSKIIDGVGLTRAWKGVVGITTDPDPNYTGPDPPIGTTIRTFVNGARNKNWGLAAGGSEDPSVLEIDAGKRRWFGPRSVLIQQTVLRTDAFTGLVCTVDSSDSQLEIILDRPRRDLPETGWVKIELSGNESFLQYDGYDYLDDTDERIKLNVSQSFFGALTGEQRTEFVTDGLSATFYTSTVGNYADMMRHVLMSTGRPEPGSTYDTLNPRAGYGYIPDQVDLDSFDDVLIAAWDRFSGQMLLSDEYSFEALFGGLLAFSQRALVPRHNEDSDERELTMVYTSVFDTSLGGTEVTDEHLVVSSSGSSPVRSKQRRRYPNTVVAKLGTIYGEDAGEIHINDIVAQQAMGNEKWEFDVQGVERSVAFGALDAWGKSLFADAYEALIYEIDVVPTLDIQTGDSITLNTSHYKFWNSNTGEVGYNATARVIGTQVKAESNVMTLTVAIHGAFRATLLSPSASIVATTSAGTGPVASDTIDVPEQYYPFFKAYLDAAFVFELSPYKPGCTNYNRLIEFDDVQLTAGVCRLTVCGTTGFPAAPLTFDTTWYMTLPQSANATDLQNLHMHTDSEGIVWR